MEKTIINYGKDENQFLELSLPSNSVQAVICLLHGGFWRMPYDLKQMDSIVEVLCQHNYAVCNIEYRRIGAGGGIFETSSDVLKALKMLECDELAIHGLPLEKLIIIGHSAGGHLALLCGDSNVAFEAAAIPKPKAIIGLAAISDLAIANNYDEGKKAISDFSRECNKDIVDSFSPVQLIPFETEVILIHGENDDYVPVKQSIDFQKKSTDMGCKTKLIIVEEEGHMEFLAPESKSIQILLKEIEMLCFS